MSACRHPDTFCLSTTFLLSVRFPPCLPSGLLFCTLVWPAHLFSLKACLFVIPWCAVHMMSMSIWKALVLQQYGFSRSHQLCSSAHLGPIHSKSPEAAKARTKQAKAPASVERRARLKLKACVVVRKSEGGSSQVRSGLQRQSHFDSALSSPVPVSRSRFAEHSLGHH